MKILITGGAGFIGSALIRHIINNTNDIVINLDKLTYAGNLESLDSVSGNKRYFFKNSDICCKENVRDIFQEYKPDAVMHLAAESHVDRSINNPDEFIHTNVLGTYNLLEISREYYEKEKQSKANSFKFHHISTDEVYGDLDKDDDPFTEKTPYNPSSPYSSSKAASDHLVRAWFRTYNLPILITNCSNNYGPYQFPEKLIPLVITNALKGKSLPIYGAGTHIRDWLFVDDHVCALYKVVTSKKIGETYNIGGHNEKSNIQVVEAICKLLDSIVPQKIGSYSDQIIYVKDRPGHDNRYAIDASKIEKELLWTPKETFESGLKKTVTWYLDNLDWCELVSNNQERVI